MKSVLQDDETHCYLCGRSGQLEQHHIYPAALRNKSTRWGCTVMLCHNCHNEPPNGVHFNREVADKLKADCQIACMDAYHWTKEEFVANFYKNYLED